MQNNDKASGKTGLVGQRHVSVKSKTWSNVVKGTNLRVKIFLKNGLVYLCLITFKAMSVFP